MSKKTTNRLLNRELSWLSFNQRVLDEAMDPRVPRLERLKFLAITASNLDEFFMVRVGGLQLLAAEGSAVRDPAGLTPRQQLKEISRRVHAMTERQYACLAQLEPKLRKAGIHRLAMTGLDAKQHAYAERLFEQEIFPQLTPRRLLEGEEFPSLAGLTIHLGLRLRRPNEATVYEAVVPLPRSLPRFPAIPSDDGVHRYLPVEELVTAFVGALFPGMELLECVPFRLTRNADRSVQEDLAADLLAQMEEVLIERRHSEGVRLEIDETASAALRKTLQQGLAIGRDETYALPGPLDLSAYFGFAGIPGFDECKTPPWPPRMPPAVGAHPDLSMFELLARQDLLFVHPYESFDPVLRFIEEAADDPDVLAIKQILYRTSSHSAVIAALARAAGHGKQVTALVELKARFDEARNIEWARALEQAGVQVIYGIRGLKTHAKICLVVRREPNGIRRYVHFGTGNYNENTARLYTDISYLTSHDDYGADASLFFNTITGITQPVAYRHLDAAPLSLRARLSALIESETQRCLQGQPAHIMAKINSLADPKLIEALYRASSAGVKIELNVRGICCLRPGVPGLSENIRVVSIVDRFLEHARILYFRHGGLPQVLISSADWMPRNLDKRIELLIPVHDADAQKRLVHILETCLQDPVKGRLILPDGDYEPPSPKTAAQAESSQAYFYRLACEASAALRDPRKTVFEPLRPPGTRTEGERGAARS